jgi:hypothetical protein
MDGRDRGGLNLYLPRAAHLSESARGRHRIGSISAFRHAIPIILPARHHPVFHPVQDRASLSIFSLFGIHKYPWLVSILRTGKSQPLMPRPGMAKLETHAAQCGHDYSIGYTLKHLQACACCHVWKRPPSSHGPHLASSNLFIFGNFKHVYKHPTPSGLKKYHWFV